jgi:hypothetical protein
MLLVFFSSLSLAGNITTTDHLVLQNSCGTDYLYSQLVTSLVLIFSARFRYQPVDAPFTVMNDIPQPFCGVQYLIFFGVLTHLRMLAIPTSVPQPNLN